MFTPIVVDYSEYSIKQTISVYGKRKGRRSRHTSRQETQGRVRSFGLTKIFLMDFTVDGLIVGTIRDDE